VTGSQPDTPILTRARPEPRGYFKPVDEGQLLDWAPLQKRLRDARNYWVATSSSDGIVHTMPVWGVWGERGFTFSTGPSTRKARNLYENQQAIVHLEDGAAVLVVEGRATEVTDAARLAEFLDSYNPKYHWNFTLDQVQRGVFELRPLKAFAWLGDEGDAFAATATRFTFDDS
jgi:nitroimidazol reductase NimA-like FMN-containing flavoprotein (pyridoxamine 5'-phosphate oxidase superfamily)